MRLLRYTVGGTKAIEEPVTLDFSENSCGIKAIYGTSGSGKSSIIGSVDTLKNCITIPGYLHDANVQKYLLEEINKKVGEMLIRVEFEDSGLAHSYEMIIRQSGDVLEYDTHGESEYAAKFAQRLITTEQDAVDTNRLYEFLHSFRSDIKAIEKVDGDIQFVYDSYKIRLDNESTGLRKLVRLYSMIERAAHGDVVFIDDLDACIHEVYLKCLVEYLLEYGKGQLCFTTQNVSLIDVLKGEKNAIDFLDEEHKLTIGNHPTAAMYRRGMVPNSPFNVDSTDFLRAFGQDEDAEG